MKKIIFFLLVSTVAFSQTAFHNFGNAKMHANTKLGVHTHLVNDGLFDDNLGLTGFYSDNEILTVSGNNRTIFNNVDIDVINNLELYTAMGITNDLLFINGKVITPRTDLNISLDFINYDVYAGEDDLRHVDGYTSIIDNNEFIFPIGDDDRLRPMITKPVENTSYFLGAYFYEDPNTPNTFVTNFTTSEKHFEIENVSPYEFWDLNGTDDTTVTLTWDSFSNINQIATNLDDLIIVGWNTSNERWENLGNTNLTGNFTSGTISSIVFTPNDYEIITLGSIATISNNYYISPNGDEVGETLIFTELNVFPLSKLSIFNRWGNLIYSRENYQNDFSGISEGRSTLEKDKKLPVGTYFYTLYYGENELSEYKQGWVYIQR